MRKIDDPWKNISPASKIKMKSDDERFDRAVATLYEILDATPGITSGYEDGMVAGMMDFLSGWFCDDIFYGVESKSEVHQRLPSVCAFTNRSSARQTGAKAVGVR